MHKEVSNLTEYLDAVILDLLQNHGLWWNHFEIIAAQREGFACYCPTSIQLEKSWEACESAGLYIEWAGEVIERRWSKASRGGVRPGNQPIGHTAFLLIASEHLVAEE